MKKLLLNLFFLTLTFYCFAQNANKQYKINFSGENKKIQIFSGSNSLTIEGYSGNEVIIEATDNNKELPEEAEGLRIISAGAVDNTGLGANVSQEENLLKIKIPKSKYFGNFKLKIPKDLSLNVKESGNNYGKWFISGMTGEIEVKTTYSTVNIKNVTGPLMARCGYGKITVVYDAVNPKKPNSISAAGAVDVTLPSETKANLKLVSSYGEVFSDFDMVEYTKPKEEENSTKVGRTENRKISSAIDAKIASANSGSDSDASDRTISRLNQDNKVLGFTSKSENGQNAVSSPNYNANSLKYWNGTTWKSSDDDCGCNGNEYTINGGGIDLRLQSDQGNIYLRKKK